MDTPVGQAAKTHILVKLLSMIPHPVLTEHDAPQSQTPSPQSCPLSLRSFSEASGVLSLPAEIEAECISNDASVMWP